MNEELGIPGLIDRLLGIGDREGNGLTPDEKVALRMTIHILNAHPMIYAELTRFREREPALREFLVETGEWIVALYDEPVDTMNLEQLHASWLEACGADPGPRLSGLIAKAQAARTRNS